MQLLRWFATIPLKWRTLFRPTRIEYELDEELRYHLERKAEAYLAQGLSADEARLAAARDFGGLEQCKDSCRDMRGWVLWVEQSWQDARYALRNLWRTPSFSIVAIVTLALGIGANAAIFTLLDGVMFKPLDIESADELVLLQRIDEQGPDPQLGIGGKAQFSYPAFQRFSSALPPTTSAVAMTRIALLHVRVGNRARARASNGQLVSGAYFSTLRITPLLGRLLDDSDNRQIDGHPVAVLSHSLWQELGSPPDIAGQAMIVNGTPITVVGVSQRGFRGVWADTPTDLWLPLSMQHSIGYRQNMSISVGQYDAPWLPQDGVTWLTLIARVPADQRPAFAAATDAVYRNDLLAEAAERKIPDERVAVALERRRLFRTPFVQGLSTLRPRFASPLYLLMGLVGLVLAVACVNVANLLLARGLARTREIGIRLAIGATRLRLVRQMVVESLVLSLLGSAVGVVVGAWFSHGLAALAMIDPFPIDGRVLVFTLALSAITAVFFAAAPIFATLGVDPARMTAASKGVSSPQGALRMKVLVTIQMALTFVAALGAVLFGRSLANVAAVDPGFESQGLVTLSFNPMASGYETTQGPALQRRLLDWAANVPGIESAALSSCALAAGCRNRQAVQFEGYAPSPDERVQTQVNDVGANYFATTGMNLIEGRGIEPRDVAGRAAVAVVNASVVRRYFGGRSPIGKHFGRGTTGPLRFEIIGVVRDARINDLMEAPIPTVFVPFPETAPGPWVLQARVSGNPGQTLRDFQATLSRFEPGLLIERATTIETQLNRNLTQQRLVAYLASGFGGLALVLACVGVYGVMAYGVARRTREIGIRIAMGANPADLMRGVLAEGTLVAAIGIALGAAASLWVTRYLGPMLYGVSPLAPVSYVTVAAVLLASVCFACVGPARRAAHADSIQALRSE